MAGRRLGRDGRVVLFDLGGVLLPYNQRRRISAIGEALGVAADAVEALVSGPLGRRLDAGADESELTDALSGLAGGRLTAEAAQALWLSVFEAPNHELWAAAARLRGRVRTGVLSDNPAFVRRMFPRDDAFDAVFLSCELGCCKPDPEIFMRVTDALGVAPGDVVFVDDVEANVAAAACAGWVGLVYRSNPQVIADLARRGLG